LDRRHFLAAGGIAAAMPLTARALPLASSPSAALFEWVNFYSDGLDLTPTEYATRLQALAAANTLSADNYSLGGSIAALERAFAERLGKEAAIFLPTGTLANHLAVRKLAGPNRRVLVQAESHLFNDSGDAAGILSGLSLVPLGVGKTEIDLDELHGWVKRSASGRVETKIGALSIETPVRRRDHTYIPIIDLQRVCGYAREQGIGLHLDGARMFSLPLHSGHGVREYAALFDTVYVSVWKHFDGASGAILAGDAAFIDGMFHTRRMFGGALPHAWPVMALVEASLNDFEAGYAQAWRIADEAMALLQADGRFHFRKLANGTSRFFMRVKNVDYASFRRRAGERGVMLPGVAADALEVVLQVNLSLLRTSAAALARNLLDAANG